MIGHELAEYFESEISTEANRDELRERARRLLDEKSSLEHNLKMVAKEPPARWETLTGSRKRKEEEIREKIEVKNELLRVLSERIFASEEEERGRAGAKWKSLKPVLQETGIKIPNDFDLRMLDLGKLERGTRPYRTLEQQIPRADPYMNGRLILSIDGATVTFSGQSMFLHGPKYPEAFFLQVLNHLKALDTLEVNFAGTTKDLADVNRTDYWRASFEWKGWSLEAEQSYSYDSTIAPDRLTKEKVLKELKKLGK